MTVQAITTIPSFSPAWKRVEEHYGAACRFGRQAVEEAWRCGDALIAAKAETKHGEWLLSLKAVGIGERTAQDLMRLRQTYAEIRKLRVFDSVHAALPSGKPDTLSDMAELGRLHRAAWHCRSVAVDEENVERLAWLMRRGVDVGPVVVRRSDGAVVDGWHRVLAARVCGATMIAVDWFDGDNEAAMRESVRRNASHGLPYKLWVLKGAAGGPE